MKYYKTILFILIISVSFALGDEGVIQVQSEQNVQKTVERLKSLIKGKGLTLFAVINHTENAKSVNMRLRPTILIIFGNPKLGTPLMQCRQTYAIDLPQKALVYEDSKGQVWIAYNSQEFLARRHDMVDCREDLQKVETALKSLIDEAAHP